MITENQIEALSKIEANIFGEFYFISYDSDQYAEEMKAAIDRIKQFTFSSGNDIESMRNVIAFRPMDSQDKDQEPSKEVEFLTFCVIILKNGFTVTGESSCGKNEFHAAHQKDLARVNAVEKIAPFFC